MKKPAIDCSPLFQKTLSRSAFIRCGKQIIEAWKSEGVFFVKNVDFLDDSLIRTSYKVLRGLHNLPSSEKLKFVSPYGTYSGLDLGEQYAEPSYEPGRVSSVRAWDYSPSKPYNKDFNSSSIKYPLLNGNSTEGFFAETYSYQSRFGRAILKAVAVGLDLPIDTFSRNYGGNGNGTMRLLHYPGSSDPSSLLSNNGISAHTDFECFTLMHQDNLGLQFMQPSGAWVDTPVSSYFMCIAGDILERYTNGYLKATPHRVLRTVSPRNSIIRFHALSPQTIIAPLAKFGSPKYSPVTMELHMKTTLDNLSKGLGAWDSERNLSKTSTFVYSKV